MQQYHQQLFTALDVVLHELPLQNVTVVVEDAVPLLQSILGTVQDITSVIGRVLDQVCP